MELKIRKVNDVHIVDINGEIDLYNHLKLKNLVKETLESGAKKVLMNFENVTYIDSSGIGSLIYIYNLHKEKKSKFLLCNIHGSVKRVIELTKLNGFLPIEDNLQNALKRILN